MNKDIMRQAGFSEEVDNVEAGNCPFCGKPVFMEDFTDALSRKEYGISGLCQKCQNEMFG
jgi:hypothetical protein